MKENLPKKAKIYFMDAVHPQFNSIPAYAWIEKGKDIDFIIKKQKF